MNKKDVTIKDVARKAGVSSATVCHTINKTRYVSPGVEERVLKAIRETGYRSKKVVRMTQFRIGKMSEVAFVISSIKSDLYTRLADKLSSILKGKGYSLCIYSTDHNIKNEKAIITNVLSNRHIVGMLIAPIESDSKCYKKLLNASLPVVFIERTVDDDRVDSVLSDSITGVHDATVHLLKNGHERIGVITFAKFAKNNNNDSVEGYRNALEEYGVDFDEKLLLRLDRNGEIDEKTLVRTIVDESATAFIAAGNSITLRLIRLLHQTGYGYPDDLSIIGFGDGEWCDLTIPSLTTIQHNSDAMAETAAMLLIDQIAGVRRQPRKHKLPVRFVIRESTRPIDRGPSGEIAVAPEHIAFSEYEIRKLRSGKYNIGISFPHGGTEWIKLHERSIRDTMYKFGINISSVVEANFNPQLQIMQLDTLIRQDLDAIIIFPMDDKSTLKKYMELARQTKLIFAGPLPAAIGSENYCGIVSVNERESGQNAGKILGDYFADRDEVKIGMLIHGIDFYRTTQRDAAAEQVLTEDYPNIVITAKEKFFNPSNAYHSCKRMLEEHPEIEGMYVSWDRPALNAIRAIEESGRSDISLSTVDLDYKIAGYLAKNHIVRGVSAQRPYEQGEAAALAVANALLGRTKRKYISIRPRIVYPQSVGTLWEELMHSYPPNFL
jgi:ribose transport system substrate-binding protein